MPPNNMAQPLTDIPPPVNNGKTVPSEISYSKLLWSSVLSLLVLCVIGYYTFDFEQFRQLIGQLNHWILLTALLTVATRIFLGGWRLSFISRGRLDLTSGIRTQLAWDFFSNVTPSAIGGGPFAAIYITRDRKIALGEATAIMLFSMLLDQLWFAVMIPGILLAMPFFSVFPDTLGRVGTLAFTGLFVGMLAWVALFGYAILFRPDLLQKIADFIFRFKWLRRFRHRVAQEMIQLRHRARILRRQPARFFIFGFLMTGGVWLSRFLLPLFIIWSVFPDIDETLVFVRTLAMTIGTLVLPTPGGSGGIEGLYVLFLGPPVMPGALVAPTLLVWRLLGYYLFIALGVYLSMHHMQKTIRHRRANARAADRALEKETLPDKEEQSWEIVDGGR